VFRGWAWFVALASFVLALSAGFSVDPRAGVDESCPEGGPRSLEEGGWGGRWEDPTEGALVPVLYVQPPAGDLRDVYVELQAGGNSGLITWRLGPFASEVQALDVALPVGAVVGAAGTDVSVSAWVDLVEPESGETRARRGAGRIWVTSDGAGGVVAGSAALTRALALEGLVAVETDGERVVLRSDDVAWVERGPRLSDGGDR
jgi:hypothetical protein